MITNIYLFNGEYDTIARGHGAKEVLVKLPKNWTIELNGFGGRLLLDSHGNERQLLTENDYGRPVPATIDNWGNRERIKLAA